MEIKKGDIVEVIKKDFSGGKVYDVGSRWEVVREDEKNGGYSDDIVHVKDDSQPWEEAALWLANVKKVEEQDRSKYNKLLTFVNEHDIPISTVNEVVNHLDKIEKLDIDIATTKKLWKHNEHEAQRMYDELSKLKIERYELQNKTTD